MKFKFSKASDDWRKERPDVNIDTIEQLLALIKKHQGEGEFDSGAIITQEAITIYDHYVE